MIIRPAVPTSIRNRGFTLIEILVVIVLISIMIGLVVVNFSPGGEEDVAEEEVLRLQNLLNFAHQQSVIRAQEYGVRFYTTGYRFMQYDELNDSWFDIANDRLFKVRTLPEPFELDLYIDQLPVEIPGSFDDDPEVEAIDTETGISTITPQTVEDKIKPHIFLLSSGELTPSFELRLRIPGSDIEEYLRGLPEGDYRRGRPDE